MFTITCKGKSSKKIKEKITQGGQMLLWFIKFILVCIFTILAYLLNPIVVLFCNEKGELPNWLYGFSTPDNVSCDIRWMVYEHCVPKFAEYDYDKHYIYHYEEKGDIEFKPGYVDLINSNFTLKERFQRYVCRVCWLYRNATYGFSSLFDIVFNTNDLHVGKNRKEVENDFYFAYEKSGNSKFANVLKLILWGHFCLWIYKRWCKWFCLRTYLGWKYKYVMPQGNRYKASIAVYVSPFRTSD